MRPPAIAAEHMDAVVHSDRKVPPLIPCELSVARCVPIDTIDENASNQRREMHSELCEKDRTLSKMRTNEVLMHQPESYLRFLQQ